jgi:hypothetical protein
MPLETIPSELGGNQLCTSNRIHNTIYPNLILQKAIRILLGDPEFRQISCIRNSHARRATLIVIV